MGVIAKYKFNQNTYANFIPEFNSEFTNYTITDEIDTDGYTIRTIESDTLPTLIRFGSTDSSGEGDYTKQSSLLEVNNLNTINVTDMSLMFYRCTNLTYINTNFNTSKVTDMYAMFSTCSSLTSLDVSNFDTSKVITMYSIFRDCSSLTSLNVSNFNTSKVDSMYCMFNNCSSLTSLNVSNFNTSKVTNMNAMFYNCSSLTSLDLSNFDTSNVTNMYYMFSNCSSLTSLNVSNFNTSKVATMGYMFQYCKSLTSLDVSNFDTSNVTNMNSMFNNCSSLTSLNVSNFNTSNVANIQYMFSNCKSLTSIDVSNFNTSKVTNMSSVFYFCRKLKNIDLSNWKTEKVTDIGSMFQACESLLCLDLSNFKITNSMIADNMVYNCYNLISLDISNFNITDSEKVPKFFAENRALTDIAMLYSSSSAINSLMQIYNDRKITAVNVWYQDANPLELTQFDNITYKEYKCVEVQQDVDSIPLTSDMFEQGYYVQSNSIEKMSLQQIPKDNNTEIRIMNKSLVKVKPNTKYILNNDSVFMWALEFDKNGAYLGTRIGTDDTLKDYMNTNTYTEYVGIVLLYSVAERNILPSDLDSMNLILQEVPQEIVLRGIGDVKDELDLTTGKLTQRIGEITFDGSEGWSKHDISSDDYFVGVVWNTISNAKDDSNLINLISNKLKCVQSTREDSVIYIINQYPIITFHKSSLDSMTIESFKKKLSELNPTIQYQLKEDVIKTINLQATDQDGNKIQSYATETHYETITPSDSLIPNITIPSTLNYDVAIKPSTEYTIRANTSDNLTVDLGGATGTLSNGKVTLTTPATLTHNEVKFSGTGKVKELMVVEGNEIKDNVPFFNGMKDVEMGGIKLVNIARYNNFFNNLTVNANKTQFTFDGNGVNGNLGIIYFDNTLIKPQTLYTVYMKIAKNTSTHQYPIKICLGNDAEYYNIPNGTTGIYKTLITSPKEITSLIYFGMRQSEVNTQVVIQNPMIIEGDWTHLDEIPFIESEMIIEQPIIRSQGKNLFDINHTKISWSRNLTMSVFGNGLTITSEGYTPGGWELATFDVYDLFKKLQGHTVVLSCTQSSDIPDAGLGIQVFINNIHMGNQNQSFTIPTEISKAELRCLLDGTTRGLGGSTTYGNIQLELGSTATPYEPYKHQTLYSNRVIGYEERCYYSSSTGTRLENNSFTSVLADVDGLEIAYVTGGSSNYAFFDKDGVFISGRSYLNTATSDNQNGFIIVPSNAKYMRFACGNADNNYTPYTKATVTGELPLRSLPNGVCDTLNLVTGEYVQRVGEIVLDGSEDESLSYYGKDNFINVVGIVINIANNCEKNEQNSIIANSIPSQIGGNVANTDEEGVYGRKDLNAIYIKIDKTKLHTYDVKGFRQYLSQNPITVQYELATPIVRKLGFTTKGNYREQVLDGSEDWNSSNATAVKTYFRQYKINDKNASNSFINIFNNKDFPTRNADELWVNDIEGMAHNMQGDIQIRVARDKLDTQDINGFKRWLSQHPMKVGYLTTTQSATSYSNILKPIFFNNVDVQFLPHNLDIQPELTYQVRTRNSYVMDMMKANTTYTMKCLSYSPNARLWLSNGTANTSITTNKSFSFAQSSLDNANKQLVIVGQWYEPMIIEGDLTGKNLPYFKGILSSYHDVDEIEVYSVNKNLFDMSKVKPYDKDGTHWWNTIIKENEVVSVRIGSIENGQFGAYIKLNVRPNSTYTLYIEMEKDGEPYGGTIYVYENDDLWGNTMFVGYANATNHLVTSQNAKYVTIGINYGGKLPIGTTLVSKNMRLYLGEESPVYIPHAHNTTLIEMPTRLETVKVIRPEMEVGVINTGNGANAEDTTNSYLRSNFIPVQPKEFIYFLNGNSDRVVNLFCYDINKNFMCYLYNSNDYVPENCCFVRIFVGRANTSDLTMTRMAYKPIQLNSLPNGVRDEIIMKPNSNKAQLVQRVGKVVLDGSEDISIDSLVMTSDYTLNEVSTYFKVNMNPTSFTPPKAPGSYEGQPNMLCDSLVATSRQESQRTISNSISLYNDGFGMRPKNDVNNAISLRTHLQQNPITVYYELATPIIHEIQLKGYPHVYENGTVTLNTDTPHQTLVSYNVNQEQLINTQNETIIRHDQQIDDLYYYIEMYLEEIYQMELFRMKLELSL